MSEQNPESNSAAEDNKWKKIVEEPEATLEFPGDEPSEGHLDAKDKELSDLKDQVLRARAEVDNVQRRAEREISNAYKYSTNKLLGDFLPVVDSLVRGLEGLAKVEDPQLQAIRHGMQLTLELLEKTLDKHGVKAINPEPGEAFNPEMHEAMSAVPNSGFAANTVVQVLQKGYQLHDRVLRAAMVMVAS